MFDLFILFGQCSDSWMLLVCYAVQIDVRVCMCVCVCPCAQQCSNDAERGNDLKFIALRVVGFVSVLFATLSF